MNNTQQTKGTAFILSIKVPADFDVNSKLFWDAETDLEEYAQQYLDSMIKNSEYAEEHNADLYNANLQVTNK